MVRGCDISEDLLYDASLETYLKPDTANGTVTMEAIINTEDLKKDGMPNRRTRLMILLIMETGLK